MWRAPAARSSHN